MAQYDGYEYDSEENRKRLSQMLGIARAKAGKSQEYMALELRVARKTVQNWEKGTTSPSFEQVVGWFRILTVNPLPYLIQYVFPEMENSYAKGSDEKIRKNLSVLVENMPIESAKQLLFLLYGEHGSSSRAVMNLMTTHLQTPLRDRVTQAGVIVRNYEFAKKKGEVLNDKNVKPDIDFLKKAIENGEDAVIKGVEEYSIADVSKGAHSITK